MVIRSDQLYTFIGNQIRDQRKALGLTQGAVAARLELTRTSITNIEAGRQKLPIELLYQICAILDVEVQTLLPPLEYVEFLPEADGDVTGVIDRVPPRTASLVRTLQEQLKEQT